MTSPPLKRTSLWLLLACALSAQAQAPAVEEQILPTALADRTPVPVVVLKKGDQFYVPFSQAAALGLTKATAAQVDGLPEPVIADLTVESAEDDLLQASVPLSYFGSQQFDVTPQATSGGLEAIPAVWTTYDLFAQKEAGSRPVGGSLGIQGSHNGYSLDASWQVNRDASQSLVTRASTTLRTKWNDKDVAIGDVSVGQALPLLASRQAMGVQISGKAGGERTKSALSISGSVPGNGIVTVSANQQVLYQASARAGTYEVRGLPTLPGETRYEVHFDDGQSVRLLGSLAADEPQGLLPEGAYEYQAAAGVPRQINPETRRLSYTGGLALDMGASFGVHRRHNLDTQAYLTKAERWLGAGIRSEWTPRLYSELRGYMVNAPGNSGNLFRASVRYQGDGFGFGAGISQFSNPRGTPGDGFLSEKRLSAGALGFNAYVLQTESLVENAVRTYDTVGLSRSFVLDSLLLNLTASKTRKDGVWAAPYYSALVSWQLGPGASVSSNFTPGGTSLNASYYKDQAWGVSAQASQATGSKYAVASGFYNTGLGTFSAATGSGGTTLGVSGGVILFRTPAGWERRLAGGLRGDSLLVVDAGAPGAEVLVEAQHRFSAGRSGYIVVPFSSAVAQRVELDLKTLPGNLGTDEVLRVAKTAPQQAFLMKFHVAPMGFPITLTGSDGKPLPEGSVAYLPEEETVVAEGGQIWLLKAAPSFKVQLAPKRYCTVTSADKEGTYQCR